MDLGPAPAAECISVFLLVADSAAAVSLPSSSSHCEEPSVPHRRSEGLYCGVAAHGGSQYSLRGSSPRAEAFSPVAAPSASPFAGAGTAGGSGSGGRQHAGGAPGVEQQLQQQQQQQQSTASSPRKAAGSPAWQQQAGESTSLRSHVMPAVRCLAPCHSLLFGVLASQLTTHQACRRKRHCTAAGSVNTRWP